ncbi:MAG: nitroreductase family protein [Firmicutes bacterium]|nr:nitroreductase family protein [Bacillota bacterium]
MDAIENIMTRKSERVYTDRRISDEDLHTILMAGMSGPSCTNARDWSFIVVRDKKTLHKMAEASGRPAEPLKNADLGILVCGDLDRAFPRAKDYWVIDGSIAAENMILAAHALGIGSVWLGTWPQMERVENQAKLFGLPDSAVPHSIIAFGYPTEEEASKPKKNTEFEADRVHYEKW